VGEGLFTIFHCMDSKNYFFTAFIIFVFSIAAFYAFKTLLPNRIFDEITVIDDNVAVDSAMVQAITEAQTDSNVVYEEEVKADTHPLARFFKKLFVLEKTKKSVVRVAYFGDSMVESDLMVHDLRKNYQDKYSGYGRGFVMLSNVHKPWGAARYDYSDQWLTYTYMKRSNPVPVGVSGYVSVPSSKSIVWTHYRQYQDAPPLARSELFYGRSNNSRAKLTIIADKDTSVITDLQTDKILNKQPLSESVSKNLMLRFSGAAGIPFYGVNFADGDGVYIDNFPMRSSSGIALDTFNEELMNAFQEELQYDLIILKILGGNIISPNVTKYGWYAERMTATINHLRKCFPGADFLIVSSPDQAKKYGTVMRTNSDLASVLRAQEKFAENSGSGFINLYQLMGGEGSMVKWVRAGMASSDYVHLNYKGAKKAADIIFQQMEDEYEEYKKENNLLVESNEGEET